MRPARTTDLSRFTHGAVYHALFDRPLAEARRVVVDLVPDHSMVLDIACGTGELCFELAAHKACRVVGIDLSRRMVEFAQKRNRFENVRFMHGDATDLADFESCVFDYATVLFLMHEIPRHKQVEVIKQALCVAPKVVVVDSTAPLPRNLHGVALRIVEASGGREHYRPFADYLAAGGIGNILADPGVKASVAQRSLFWHGCRELVVLDREPKTSA